MFLIILLLKSEVKESVVKKTQSSSTKKIKYKLDGAPFIRQDFEC
jgi:hypothetical protein